MESLSSYLKKIIDSQKNIVVVTDFEKIKNANKSFFKFFEEYNSVEDFTKEHCCISDIFEEVDKFGFVYKNMINKEWNKLNESWFEYVLNNRKKNNKVLIKRESREYIFNISISMIQDGEYLVDFTDITDIENYKFELETIVNKKSLELADLNKNLEESIQEKIQELHDLNKELNQSIKDEKEKNTLKDQFLFKQSRQAMMGEMIGMIAHQWKQPLSSMNIALNSLEIAKQFDTLTDELFVQNIEKMKKTIEFLVQTMDQFRNFFKEDKEKSKVAMINLIEEGISYIEHQLNIKNISVNIECTSKEEVAVHPNELVQVFMNVINNAKDASISNNIENATIDIKCYDEDNDVVIEIKDNAGGIPEDIIDNLFNPYFSTKGQDGTGLGLYMSKIIVEDHSNGRISAKNYDDGAIFTIKIPLDDDN
jgi:signal transduction histidine kinase